MIDATTSHSASQYGAAYHDFDSAEALTDRNVRTIVELERSARAARGPANRMADTIARFCGTLKFVWIHVAWFAAWILLNVWPGGHHPDPYPFTFLTLMVSLEAIFLSTFILISQNLENKVAERRSQLDLQINLLTEQENTKMLRMLKSIAEKVGADVAGDPEVAVLEESTRPENLLAQIERASVEVGEMRREDDKAAMASTLNPTRS